MNYFIVNFFAFFPTPGGLVCINWIFFLRRALHFGGRRRRERGTRENEEKVSTRNLFFSKAEKERQKSKNHSILNKDFNTENMFSFHHIINTTFYSLPSLNIFSRDIGGKDL